MSSSLFFCSKGRVLFPRFHQPTKRERILPKMDELVYTPNTTFTYTYFFNFEKNFDFKHAQMWMKDHFPYCFLYCALYVILIFGGKHYMSNRPKYDLRRVLVLWSASLALFSIIAVCRTLPIALRLVQHHGFYHTTCALG